MEKLEENGLRSAFIRIIRLISLRFYKRERVEFGGLK